MPFLLLDLKIVSSLPLGVIEPKRLCILGDGTLGLVQGAIREIRLDFDADFHLGIWVGSEYGNDFLRDLDETHLGRGGVDADISME